MWCAVCGVCVREVCVVPSPLATWGVPVSSLRPLAVHAEATPRGGGQHCFVSLEPLGVSAPYLVVTLEHSLVHVNDSQAPLWSILEEESEVCFFFL